MSLKRVERLRQKRNITGLCRMLRHRDPLVRRRAIAALGEINDQSSTMPLITALENEADSWARQALVDVLRNFGNVPAIDALTRHMFSLDRTLSPLAMHALAQIAHPRAQTAVVAYDLLTRNAFDALYTLGPEGAAVLEIVTSSSQFKAWPSGKQRRVLDFAVGRGVKPTEVDRKQMAELGIFVNGVHTAGDLTSALSHQNPEVRAAAAQRLAEAGQTTATGTLYRQFMAEVKAGPLEVSQVAIARALTQLADTRAIRTYLSRLEDGDDAAAMRAASGLAKIAHADATRALFRFALKGPPARRPMALNALETMGPEAVEHLRHVLAHESHEVRRLMVSVVQWSGHEERLNLLAELAVDPNVDVQRAAIYALVASNNEDAAAKLYLTWNDGPRALIEEALATMSHPAGPDFLRRLVPGITVVEGKIRAHAGGPLEGAYAQIVKQVGGPAEVAALSARAATNAEGGFALALRNFTEEATVLLRVIKNPRAYNDEPETFLGAVTLIPGRKHRIEARIDPFFDRLQIRLELVPD